MSDTPRVDKVAPHLNLSNADMRAAASDLRDLARQLERELNEAKRKEDRLAQMLEWLAENLEDVQIGGVDPTQYINDEDDTWSMAWERALDDVLKPAKPATSESS